MFFANVICIFMFFANGISTCSMSVVAICLASRLLQTTTEMLYIDFDGLKKQDVQRNFWVDPLKEWVAIANYHHM